MSQRTLHPRTNLVLLPIQIIAGLLVTFGGFFAYLKGASISMILTNAVYWADGYLLFHLNALCCRDIYEDEFSRRTYTLFGLAFLVLPVVYAGQMFRFLPANDPWLFDVSIVIQATFLGLAVYTVGKPRLSDKEKTTQRNADANIKEKTPQIQAGNFLGQGEQDIDTVIRSLKARVTDARRFLISSASLMFAVVLFGGIASIGSEAFDKINTYHQIAIQRNALEDLVIRLNNGTKDDSLRAFYTYISKNFGKDYHEAIQRLATPNTINWPDIILRITIALFTLFLVQVLFSVYKYNQQQISHLYSKAELIELYRPDAADKPELRKGLLARVENSPRFEKGPAAPTEQIINVLEKTVK